MRNYVYLIFILIGTNDGVLDICNSNFERITDFSTKDCEAGKFYHSRGNEKFPCLPKCFGGVIDEEVENSECDDDHPNLEPCPVGYICDQENRKCKNTDGEKIEDYVCNISDDISNLKPCPPGYDCNKQNKCEINEESCFKYEANYKSNKWNEAYSKPECLPDGTWAPRQCKGDSGSRRCFCSDPKGNRIFGQEFSNGSISEMTCACSRKRLELTKADDYNFYPTLHCSSNGNYEALQCNAGNCWCVEETTGKIISEVVPETMMKYLTCRYNRLEIGEQYMRRCESEEYAQAKILHELNRHGTEKAVFDHILCDADGSYGAYNIKSGVVTCKWRDNSNLNGGSSIPVGSVINCNCARDKRIFQDAGLTNDKLCTESGGYDPLQRLTSGEFYCVDVDGYRKSDYLTEASLAICAEYL